jgi:hypothetical protein
MQNGRTIRAALAVFKGNIYEKHLRTRIVLPATTNTVPAKKIAPPMYMYFLT